MTRRHAHAGVAGAWLLIASSLVGTVAHAQQEICSSTLTTEAIDGALDSVSQGLENGELTASKDTLKQLNKDFTCLAEPASRNQISRYAVMMSLTAFFEQDEGKATKFLGLALVAQDEPDYPEWLPEMHPYRYLVDEVELPPLGRVPGGIAVPKKGGAFINGALTMLPEAYAEVPSLVQVFDGNKQYVQSYWQEGAAFPPDMIVTGGGPYKAPKWYDGPAVVIAPEDQVVVIDALEPGPEAQTMRGSAALRTTDTKKDFPLLPVVAGGGLAVLSGTLYALAGASRSGLGNATNEQELVAARSRTNALAISSGVAAVGAVGVGVTGVMLTGNGFILSGRF